MIRRLTALALPLLVLVLAGCSALKYQTAEAPRVSLASLGVQELGLVEQRFDVGLRLRNPNDFALPISGVEYQVQLEGESFASGITNDRIELPAMGEQVISLGVTTSLINNLQRLRRWQRSPPDSLPYTVSGRVTLAGVPIRLPFDYSGKVPLTMGFNRP
jgi:LEA14-like dessication related protein